MRIFSEDLTWSTKLLRRPLYWTVVALSRVDLMGTPSVLTTMVPMTPLWATSRLRVSSTSDAIVIWRSRLEIIRSVIKLKYSRMEIGINESLQKIHKFLLFWWITSISGSLKPHSKCSQPLLPFDSEVGTMCWNDSLRISNKQPLAYYNSDRLLAFPPVDLFQYVTKLSRQLGGNKSFIFISYLSLNISCRCVTEHEPQSWILSNSVDRNGLRPQKRALGRLCSNVCVWWGSLFAWRDSHKRGKGISALNGFPYEN